MKQIYFLISAMFIGTLANAQVKMPVQAAKDVQASSVYLNTEAPVQAARAVFWSHDCDVNDCSDWSFDNAAYEVDAPWTDIDINFECTTDGPSGPYNQWAGGSGDGSAASSMNSTTSSNGTIIVDSDLFGADANYDANWVENCWFQTVAPIDCSEHPYVSISLETRYRCWDNGGSDDSEKCLIEVSRDGVNWPAIDNWDEASGYVIYGTDTVASRKEVFPGYETSDTSDNPSLLEFDITDAAGEQTEVYVRFRWSGTWGYSWEIDDIKVYDTPANDTRIDNYLSYTDYERTGYYEYGAWPLSQIPADLAAAAKVYNVGFEDQTNVTLDVTAAGTTAYSTPITLSYATADTLSAAYLPTALGPVTVDYLLTADAADENPGNNMASQSFEVTDLSWGRDEGTPVNAAPAEGTDDYIAVSLFDIVDDVVIYAIDVAVMAGSETGTSIITHLFDGFDDNFLAEQYGGILQSTDEFDIIAGNTNEVGVPVTNWYTLVFDEPYLASAGDWLGAGFEHYGGSNVQYGESKYTQDNTAFIYGPFGAGSAYDWYYTNEVPMVRLNLNPNAVNTISEETVNTTGFEMFPSFPNPTNGVTRIQFRLDRAADVNFEVIDITGKIVYTLDMGTQAPGYNSISVDASEFAAGVYTYTLSVDGERSTDRLMVK
ncbi:MAG: T9SS type A sorting domain-containing protein [Flavobacteriales bacterium]